MGRRVADAVSRIGEWLCTLGYCLLGALILLCALIQIALHITSVATLLVSLGACWGGWRLINYGAREYNRYNR